MYNHQKVKDIKILFIFMSSLKNANTFMETIQNYIKTNEKRFIDELIELLKIPSVSADSKYAKDVVRAAEYVKAELVKAGADKVEICTTPGHPIVYGEKIIDPKYLRYCLRTL
jgi:acetylornithine deacetylase/succinyl-diaminopimelate desuccinylase-like protein